MASYVPPHKRHTNGLQKPTPAIFVPQFKNKPNSASSSSNTYMSKVIVYADRAICRWFALGVDHDKIPSNLHLEPVSVQLFGLRTGERPLALVNNQPANDYNCKDVQKLQSIPWEYIAVNVWRDLVSSYEIVRSEVETNKLEQVRSTLVANIGRVLFRQNSFGRLGTFQSRSLSGSTSGRLNRSFYTNLPLSYVENIRDLVVPKVGFAFEEEKDIYHIKLSDKTCPETTISCKCRVNKDDGKLELYKIELNQVRQLVVDISCIHKDLDLRLMLCTKKTVTSLTDGEKDGIRSLVNLALLDPNVRGGLRWPLGKACCADDRFTVVRVWHTVSRTYSSSLMKLKIGQADRYNFSHGTGEASHEVILKLKGLAKELKENECDADSVSHELKDALKTICEHFLDCDLSL